MFAKSLPITLLALAGVIEARSVSDPSYPYEEVHKRQNKNTNNNNNQDLTATILAANAIQTGSFVDGSPTGAEAKSQTSQNNFINNCGGKSLTNGLQILGGSCNGIPMGDIPAKTNMVSSIITFPLYGSATIQAETTFNISVQMANLIAGSFTNADATYYAAPQQLSGGKVVGHTHVTVQDLGKSLNPQKPLDATQFAFFKGINDAGNGKGLLQAVVTGGLPAGNYRVCTMASSSNHAPVLMPVAQRGTPDDCSKFTVVGKGGAGSGTSNAGGNGNAASSAAAGGKGASTSAIASETTKPGGKGANNGVDTATKAATSSKAASGGKGASASVSKASVSKTSSTTKTSIAGKSSSVSAASTAAASKGGKGKSGSSLATAPFANNTFILSSSTARGGNGGKAVVQPSTTAEAASASASTSQKGGKAVSTGTVVHKVTVIQTFFEFIQSLGGLPPSIGKQGSSFACLGELFDDLPSAANAACGHQYTTCVGFSGPGFSFEECQIQKESCGVAASSASASAAPVAVTATVTVPVSVTVTGSVIAESTVSVTATAAGSANTNIAAVAPLAAASAKTTAAGVQPTAVAVVGAAAPSADSSVCSIVTMTVTVDSHKETSSAVASQFSAKASAAASSTKAPFSNSTATATTAASAAASKPVQVSNLAALGGITAPAVTNSGDATRPFTVNGDTFVNKSAAAQRACDVQFNACANAVNGGKISGVEISDCQSQKNSCGTAAV